MIMCGAQEKDYCQEFKEVSNPEDYPKKAFNEDCAKCEHGTIRFYRGNYGFRFQGTLCLASKMLICAQGFIGRKEFTV